MKRALRRAAIVFSGGPAPAANAVIGSAVMALRRGGAEVLGMANGYSYLADYRRGSTTLAAGEHYIVFDDHHLRGLRNARGIVIGTARTNPGRGVERPEDLDDPERTAGLRAVYEALVDLDLDALVSIGGDDTLRTANLLYEFQRRLPPAERRVAVVHVPKTIDNDYRGIDFTFGFFTAVDVMAKALLNLRADALATRSYYVVETMGRRAGWLSYGVAIAGEAHLVVGVEDVTGPLAVEETVRDARTGAERTVKRLSLDALADRVADLVEARAARGKHYGTVVLAEGLAELFPEAFLRDLSRDEHGHVSLGKLDVGKVVAKLAGDRIEARTGKRVKLTGVQLGYESRCSAPHAFDVMLGCQLGAGAHRALAELELDGHMVSVAGQLELAFVPFSALIDPKTLRADVRYIRAGSDFHRLAHQLGTRLPERGA